MQFYISPEERRVTVSQVVGAAASEAVKAKAPPQRRLMTCRTIFPAVLIAGILLPFLFILSAFLALDAGTSVCPSISCLRWRIGSRFLEESDSSLEIMKEIRSVYMDGTTQRSEILDADGDAIDTSPESVADLIAEMGANQQFDAKTFALRTKAMLLKMERKLRSTKLRTSIFRHLASIGIPKTLNCLTLRLSEEYLDNAAARSSLPPPEYASRINSPSRIHLAFITDNVLAASVAVSSALTSSGDPENLVFHIVTDKKTYAAMHAWFSLHSVSPAIVEVKGLHQFNFDPDTNAAVEETAEEINRCLLDRRRNGGGADEDDARRIVDGLKPSTFSLMNYLRMHLPELFPKLNRVIFLDDDVVVRRDLTPLWDLHLNGNVIGAVMIQESDELGNYKSSRLKGDQCVWLEGMNVVDLRSWRRTNITQVYRHWIKLNRESTMGKLWPPALIAFNGQVQTIKASWHLAGLGLDDQMPDNELLDSAAVLHFSGPGKPWLEISHPELRKIWRSHLNQSDQFLRCCKVV